MKHLTPSEDDLVRWSVESRALQSIRRRTNLDLQATCRRRLGASTLVTLSVVDLMSIINVDVLRDA